MRAASLLFAFTFGVVAMSTGAPAPGQDKKDPSKKESYDEKVTVRYWDGKKFHNPIKDVPAFRLTDKSGVRRIWTQQDATTSGNPDKGSELIDKDGNVYVCEKVSRGSPAHVCTVRLKPKDK